MRPVERILCAALCLAQLGCLRNPAPRSMLPSKTEALSDAFGGWVVIRPFAAGEISGELIAVTRDTVFVLAIPGLRVMPVDSIRGATLVVFKPETAHFATWTTFGVIGTISNGWFLIFTTPTWVILGTSTAVAVSKQPVYNFFNFADPLMLSAFCRFPGGLPPALDRSTLRMQPARMR